MKAVCLASGPSLTAEDVNTINQWRGNDNIVIAVNRTFELAPWADHFVANDAAFWIGRNGYGETIRKLGGKMWAASRRVPYAETLPRKVGNSGATAILLADWLGAETVFLLGYDLAYDGEKRHFHDDYPVGLGNGGSVAKWPKQFKQVKEMIDCYVINCTRGGILELWPRAIMQERT